MYVEQYILCTHEGKTRKLAQDYRHHMKMLRLQKLKAADKAPGLLEKPRSAVGRLSTFVRVLLC